MKRQNPTQQYRTTANVNGGTAVFGMLTIGVAKLGVSGLNKI